MEKLRGLASAALVTGAGPSPLAAAPAMTSNLWSCFFRLRPDAFFVAAEGGAWLRNNRGSFFVRGKSAYSVIRSLFSSLDGTRTLSEICAGLGETERAVVARQVSLLLAHGFLKEVAQPPEDIPTWAKDLYGSHLAFLDEHLQAPFAGFMAFHGKTVACLGDGPVLRAMLVALVEHGAGQILIGMARQCTEDERGTLERLANGARTRDPSQRIDFLDPGTADALERLPWSSLDCLIAAQSVPVPMSVMARMGRIARTEGVVFGAVAPIGELLVASPVIGPDDAFCWECLHRGLHVAAEATGTELLPPAPTVAALAANQLTHRLFCQFTGVPLATQSFSTVDGYRLTLRNHSPSRHPLCQDHGCSEVTISPMQPAMRQGIPRPDLPSSEDSEMVIEAQNRIAATIAGWTDPIAGPLLFAGEGALTQLPLSTSCCVIRDIASRPEALASFTVNCKALSAREARNQSVLFAIERVASDLLVAIKVGLPGTLPVGAGWSPDEAVWRASMAASLQWRAKTTITTEVMLSVESLGQEAELAYLLHTLRILCPSAADMLRVVLAKAPTGLYTAVATISDDNGTGAGISERQAGANALLDLACRLIRSEEELVDVGAGIGVGALSAAYLRLLPKDPTGAWTPSPACLDISGILPFVAGNLWIAAYRRAED